MKYGIDYNDEGGRTPLMYAVLGNQIKVSNVCAHNIDFIIIN